MKVSDKGLALIEKYEGFSAVPYLCPATSGQLVMVTLSTLMGILWPLAIYL